MAKLWHMRALEMNPHQRDWLAREYQRVSDAYVVEQQRRLREATEREMAELRAEGEARAQLREAEKEREWPLGNWGVVTGVTHPELEGKDDI